MKRFLAAIRRLRTRLAAQTPRPTAAAALSPDAADAVRQALADTEARADLGKQVAAGPISRNAADQLWAEPQPRNTDTRDPLTPVIPVDPSTARPGDIAAFADHTAIVAGNGQLIGPAGQQHPTGPGFQGIFRPAPTVNKDANTNELKGVGEV